VNPTVIRRIRCLGTFLVLVALGAAGCTPMTVVRPPEVSPGLSIHAQVGVGPAPDGQDDDGYRWFWMCFDESLGCTLAGSTWGVNGEAAVNYGHRPRRGLPWSVGVVANSLRVQGEAYVQILDGARHAGGFGGRVGIPALAPNREQTFQGYALWSPAPRTDQLRVVFNPTVTYRRIPLEPAMTAWVLSPSVALDIPAGPIRLMPSGSYTVIRGRSAHNSGVPDTATPFRSAIPMISVGVSRGRNPE
jgi:hypothetical protein